MLDGRGATGEPATDDMLDAHDADPVTQRARPLAANGTTRAMSWAPTPVHREPFVDWVRVLTELDLFGRGVNRSPNMAIIGARHHHVFLRRLAELIS